MKDLTVFVLTHNRGKMLLETIKSVLNQTCHDFKFIVSDNSSNDETKNLIYNSGLRNKFEYRKREKEYTSLDHFNLCLSEVDTSFFILFHDDDIMMPDFVNKLYNSIEGTEYIAVGCNAYFLYGDKKTKRKFFNKYSSKIIKISSYDIAKMYCVNRSSMPYPSYIYNRKKIGEEKFDNECGKYSDVTWLLRLSEKAPLLWLTQPLMYYRIHNDQDSNFLDLYNQFKLANKYETLLGKRNKMVRKYKYDLLCLKIYLDISAKLKKGFLDIGKIKVLFCYSKFYFIKIMGKTILQLLSDK